MQENKEAHNEYAHYLTADDEILKRFRFAVVCPHDFEGTKVDEIEASIAHTVQNAILKVEINADVHNWAELQDELCE